MDSKYKKRSRHAQSLKARKENKKMYKKVGFFRIVGDLLLGFLTGGIWWLILLIKYIRSNTR